MSLIRPIGEMAVLAIREFDMRRHYHDESAHIGILDVLGLIFIVLKLVGVIDWSWWLVLAPWWIPVVLVLIMTIANWLDD